MSRLRVALVGGEQEENLSLRYLAAAVERAGFEAVLVRHDGPAHTQAAVEAVCAARPLVVGLSLPFQLRSPDMLALASALRLAGYAGHLCCGGHFATFEFENLLRHHPAVDSVVRHEGEETLAELCARLRDGLPLQELPGLVVRGGDGVRVGPRRALPALDSLPFPLRKGEADRELGIPCAPLVGSRGCYADCSFCCISAYGRTADGPRYRARSVESIAAEMVEERRRRGVRLFVFHDDNFLVPSRQKNLERCRALGQRLRAAGLDDIALVIKCRPNDVDRELFAYLKQLGVIRVYVGIESSSEEGLLSLNRRITAEDNRRALGTLRQLGIYATFNMLLFDPEATLEGFAQNLGFLDDYTDFPFNFCRAEVYAGTALEAKLRAEGRLEGSWLGWTYAMRQPRVELLFRIASTAFGPRNFHSNGIANLNMGIRFDLAAARWFHPTAWDEGLEARAVALSRAVGADTLGRLRLALDFVRRVELSDSAGVKAFTVDLARGLARADLALLGEIKALRRELDRRLAGAAAIEAGPTPRASVTTEADEGMRP